MADGLAVIERLAREQKLFRERDVRANKASTGCLADARVYGIATPHGHGVWSHPNYVPTRYELLQIRFKKAVFWGPSALWLLQAEKTEPDGIWIAIGNNSRPPTRLDLTTVVVRTRSLERDVTKLEIKGRALTLRVHSLERARADVSRNDCAGLLTRALMPRSFVLAPEAEFLSGHVRPGYSSPLPPPRDEWDDDDEPDEWSIAHSLFHAQ